MQTLAPTWNLSSTATTKWYVRLFPSLNDLAFLLPIVVLFAKMNGTAMLFSDGDTGWHIRTGEWIVTHHAVPHVDLFSFSKPGADWFAWEWLWDVIFAGIHRLAGLGGVGFVTTLMLGAFSLLVYRLALRVSHNNLMSMVVCVLTAAVSSIHWLARPHLVTWIFTLLFLDAIESAQSGNRRALYWLPVLMVFWANMHGGFVAGLMIIFCYGAGETLSTLVQAEPLQSKHLLKSTWQRSAAYWQCLGLCSLATFINPYGWQLHKHVFNYLTDTELLDKIQEFQSISFHAGPAILFEIMLVLASFVVFSRIQARQFAPVLLICLWAHYALLSARHIPLFMIVAAPFVAVLLSVALRDALTIPALRSVSAALADICKDLRALEFTPRLHLVSASVLILMGGLFAVGRAPFAAQFNPEAFPIQAIPVLERAGVKHIFTTDQWADYVLYRLYPVQKVFFDGRSDFYGNDFVRVNQRISAAEHDWKALLLRFKIDLVMVKPESPLSAVLKLSPGSKVLFDDGKVIVFDISGLYPPIWEKDKTANRAARLSPTLQLAPARLVAHPYRPVNLQKG